MKAKLPPSRKKKAEFEKRFTVTLPARVTMRIIAEDSRDAQKMCRELLGSGKRVLAESGGMPFGLRVLKAKLEAKSRK